MVIRNDSQLNIAKSDLFELREAWRKALHAQSYSVEGNQINRASVKELRNQIDELESAIAEYERYGSTKRRAVRIRPM